MYSKCRECCSKDTKEDRDKRQETWGYYNRNGHLKRKYNISLEQYKEMFNVQNGCCYLCNKKVEEGRMLCVDHNHSTGKIRKLLCTQCNAGLGNFRENVEVLNRAIEYVKENEDGHEY